MPRLDQAISGQCWGLATLDDRADNVWRQEGKIHDVSDAALDDTLTVGDRLHGRSGLDLHKPDPAQGDGFDQRGVQSGWRVGEHEPGFDPRLRNMNSPTSDSALRPICAGGMPSRSAMAIGHRVTDSSPGSTRVRSTIALRVGPRSGPLSAEQSDFAAEGSFLSISGVAPSIRPCAADGISSASMNSLAAWPYRPSTLPLRVQRVKGLLEHLVGGLCGATGWKPRARVPGVTIRSSSAKAASSALQPGGPPRLTRELSI